MAQQAMYASKLKEVVPLIRYCKYNLARHGGSAAATATDLAKLKMTAMVRRGCVGVWGSCSSAGVFGGD